MVYNEGYFIKAVEQSFRMYKLHGARSTEKLKPIHRFVANVLYEIWGKSYDFHYIGGDNTKEMKVEGKYYQKDIDITVSKNGKAVFLFGYQVCNFKL